MGKAIHGIVDHGTDGTLIDIECHITNGLPTIIIVGFANKAVDEAKERLRGAFNNSGLVIPKKRVAINLAPADIPKDSTGFDLPIAVSILSASEQIDKEHYLTDTIFIGELGLDGSLRAVRGIIGKITQARKLGFKKFYIPVSNLDQAKLIPNIAIYAADNLRQVYLHLANAQPIEPKDTGKINFTTEYSVEYSEDFKNIVGQARAKRALEIAAAGSHNVLLNGPPGTGKSMLAKALPSILPSLNREEMLEITHLNSLASKNFNSTVLRRPFQSPHHSSSDIAIIGGGQNPRPGQISLAHRGVLFLDELPEFSRLAIESLRQPLEDKIITVSRAKDSFTYPANFILVATANPCPCGYYGTSKDCSCSPYQIVRYQKKLSGPIIDRIDMYIDVEEVVHRDLLSTGNQEPSKNIAVRVKDARIKQQQRFKSNNKANSDMTNQDIKKLALLTTDSTELLNQASETLQISARHYMRTIKVARTIADLDSSVNIEKKHIAEALQFRKKSEN